MPWNAAQRSRDLGAATVVAVAPRTDWNPVLRSQLAEGQLPAALTRNRPTVNPPQ